jgi:predicted secreted protein
MKRAKKIIIVSHCVLNSNSKIYPLASEKGVYKKTIGEYIDEGCAIFQLPCPENSYLGMKRWGMTFEQYNSPNFVKHCEEVLKFPIIELKNLHEDGCEFVGVLGMDGSPNCGIYKTCVGFSGGEICSKEAVLEQADKLEMVSKKGVFMEVFLNLLEKNGIKTKLLAIEE